MRIKGNRSISGRKNSGKIIIFILKEINERLNLSRLRGFKEIESGNYHVLSEEFFTQ